MYGLFSVSVVLFLFLFRPLQSRLVTFPSSAERLPAFSHLVGVLNIFITTKFRIAGVKRAMEWMILMGRSRISDAFQEMNAGHNWGKPI